MQIKEQPTNMGYLTAVQRRQMRWCASLKYKSHILRGKKQGREYCKIWSSTTPIVAGYHHQLNTVSCKPTSTRKATTAPQPAVPITSTIHPLPVPQPTPPSAQPPAGWRRDSGTNGRRRAPGKTHPHLKNLKNLHTLNFFKSPGGMRR